MAHDGGKGARIKKPRGAELGVQEQGDQDRSGWTEGPDSRASKGRQPAGERDRDYDPDGDRAGRGQGVET